MANLRQGGCIGSTSLARSTVWPMSPGAMASSRCVSCREVRREEFPYELKAGPAGGRLRRPPSRRQRHDDHQDASLTRAAAA